MKTPNPKSIAYYCKLSITQENKNYNPCSLGAFIVKWERENQNLDYKLHHMYVCKKDTGEFQRGQQFLTKPNGVECRDIYFYKKETREALAKLLWVLDLPTTNQIGFTRNRGIQDVMLSSPWKKDVTRIKLDLKDAFNSISSKQIFWLLRITFDVNKKLANKLSRQWTTNGHMLQGHPLAPAIFNLVTRDLNRWLSDRTGIIQYADDILIYENSEYISWKWLKVIMRKYEELGFKMNIEKEGIFHGTEDLTFLGMRFTFQEEKPLVSASRRKRRKILRKIEHNCSGDKWQNAIYRGNYNWYQFDGKIVFEKVQSQKESISEDKVERKGTKLATKPHKSGGRKLPSWVYWVNPTTLPPKYRALLLN